ncbi:hypothetical protein HU200_060315 [Digitaria exilis]|uniref:Cytochrome P450 n=1 Tax=Digitaria exilis TaxID=1010633 RepID=A0A835AAH0_9POAL|nr:hypothetical protein HU200_060315 [Digitaria exilis]
MVRGRAAKLVLGDDEFRLNPIQRWPMVHAMLDLLLHRFEWTLPQEVKENGVDMSESLGLTMIMATPLQATAKSV